MACLPVYYIAGTDLEYAIITLSARTMNEKLFLNDVAIISTVLFPKVSKVVINKSTMVSSNKMTKEVFQQESREDYALIDFENELNHKEYQSLRFSFINNPDGSMRWIYPATSAHPGFLSFYSGSTLKAKFYKIVVKILFLFGLKDMVRSGSFTIWYKQNLNPLLKERLKPNLSFSIFTGTIGVFRKIQIEFSENGKTQNFVKIPFTEESRKMVSMERINLKEMNKRRYATLIVPQLLECPMDDALCTSNNKSSKFYSTYSFENNHIQALLDLYDGTIQYYSVKNLSFINRCQQQIKWLSEVEDFKFSRRLLERLSLLINKIDTNQKISVGRAHKDFTPWNMYVAKDKLYVYDWEACEHNMPLLYDFFHFHFQSGILIQRKNFNEILNEVKQVLQNEEIKTIILKYNINIETHMALYLLCHVTESLVLYQKQYQLHTQVQWLIKTWEDALHYCLMYMYESDIRNFFVQNLLDHLKQVPYAWMKFGDKNIDQLNEHTDIDLLIEKRDLPFILDFINQYSSFGEIKVCQKSNMTTVNIYFHQQQYLSLDLIYEFKRKQYWYMDTSDILSQVSFNQQGVKVPQLYHDFEYMLLFYTLNGSNFPAKYVRQFASVGNKESESILNYLNGKYCLAQNTIDEMIKNNLYLKDQLILWVKNNLKQNKLTSILSSYLNYWMDCFREIFYNQGFVMTISGVDGAGKSTIIQDLKDTFEMKYRKKIKVLRHRPSLLPILSSFVYGKINAEKKAAENLPRQGTNKNIITSAFRFLYYFLDYQVGQVYIFFRYVCRGYIVIYDRYYFDFINDGKRSNIYLPKGLIKFLYKLIYKPRLNVLLYASPEIILKRKQELSQEDIFEMTDSYRQLFDGFSKRYTRDTYLMIENIHKESTVKRILENYCEVLIA